MPVRCSDQQSYICIFVSSLFLSFSEPLNDGQWKQVVALEYYNLTKLILGEQSKIIEYKRIKLNTYSLNPFNDSIQQESVFIAQSYKEPESFVHLFVGGVGEGGTAIPFLKGCVRGMRVGNYHINLRQGVRARGNTSGTVDFRKWCCIMSLWWICNIFAQVLAHIKIVSLCSD